MSWALYRSGHVLWICPFSAREQSAELLAGGSYDAVWAAMRLFGEP